MRCTTAIVLAALSAAPLTVASSASTPNAAAAPSSTAATPVSTTAAVAEKSLLERSLRVEGAVLAPQPSASDFATLKQAGISRVINLRAPEEMAALGFDAETAAKDAGLGYTLLPVAGSAGFTPAVLDAFAKAMAEGGGDILLHCGSGARAGQLYAAWLVREKGMSPQDAMERVAPLGLWPTPMERLLGRPLEIDFAPASRSADPDAPKAD